VEAVEIVRYADVVIAQVVAREEIGPDRRMGHRYYLILFLRDGGQMRFSLGNVIGRALPDILRQLRSHNVPVFGIEDLPAEIRGLP
jgi:hypothetical protein